MEVLITVILLGIIFIAIGIVLLGAFIFIASAVYNIIRKVMGL